MKKIGKRVKKRLILRYLFLSIPFVSGIILLGLFGINIASSLLIFGGGYMLVKNIFDYRYVDKNIRLAMEFRIDKVNNEEGNILGKDILSRDIDGLKMNEVVIGDKNGEKISKYSFCCDKDKCMMKSIDGEYELFDLKRSSNSVRKRKR